MVKRQIDQEIARLKKLEEKPKKEMSLLQYYKLNAIKRPEFKQRIALGKNILSLNILSLNILTMISINKHGNITHVSHHTLMTKYIIVSVLPKITELKGCGLLLTKIRVTNNI